VVVCERTFSFGKQDKVVAKPCIFVQYVLKPDGVHADAALPLLLD
jgi:hypothetical protein